MEKEDVTLTIVAASVKLTIDIAIPNADATDKKDALKAGMFKSKEPLRSPRAPPPPYVPHEDTHRCLHCTRHSLHSSSPDIRVLQVKRTSRPP